MNNGAMTEFVVFYAWQDDLPGETNLNVIRDALRDASSRLEDEFAEEDISVRIRLDEATRERPGSPNIPATILDKISTADAFVCDVTTINQDCVKRVPNPNVVFELGYAVSQLGWGRVIMLYNQEFGTFPDDMPFDFDRHRVTHYSLATPERKLKAAASRERRRPLADTLCVALRAILENDPQKPFTGQSLTPTQIKRTRDVNNLKLLMLAINIPALEKHIADLPGILHNDSVYFIDAFNEITGSLSFYLYNTELRQLITDLSESWNNTFKHMDHYRRHHPAATHTSLYYPEGHPTEETDRTLKDIIEFRNRLFHALHDLLIHLREHYLEIDVDELSKNAWCSYREMTQEIEDRLFGQSVSAAEEF